MAKGTETVLGSDSQLVSGVVERMRQGGWKGCWLKMKLRKVKD
jgi:hypothetical protein